LLLVDESGYLIGQGRVNLKHTPLFIPSEKPGFRVDPAISRFRALISSMPNGWMVAAFAGVVAAWIAFDTFSAMITNHVSLPFWDQWRTVAEYRMWLDGEYGVKELFSQHNEHRIAVGRLFFFADILGFDGRGVFLSTASAMFLSGLASLLIFAGRPSKPAGWKYYGVHAACVVGCCLTFVAYENLLWPFQVPFVLLYLAATAGLYATMRASIVRRQGAEDVWWTVVAVGCFALATYCMANGLAAPALSVVLALALKARWRVVAILAAAFALLTVSYFHGYLGSQNPNGLDYLVSHPFYLPTYLGMFIGNILRDFPHREPSTLMLGLLGFGLCFAIVYRTGMRGDRQPVRLFLVAIMLLVLAAGLASGAGLTQALAPRYVTPGALFWACQAIYWHSVAADNSARWARPVAAGGALVLLALLTVGQLGARHDAADFLTSLTAEADALLVGVRDRKAESASTPFEINLPRDTALLRQTGKSIYADPEAHWMGQPLSAIGATGGNCIGSIDTAQPLADDPRGVKLVGWSWNTGLQTRIERIIVVDRTRKIVGLATGGHYRPDVPAAILRVTHVASGFNGYAVARAGDKLSLFGLVGPRTVCPLGEITASGQE
jgi:hypothetical protein